MNFNHVFFAAPHRVMFFAGAVQLMLTMLLWALDLGARHAGLYATPEWAMPPTWMHATLMIFGLFSFFVFGFLMTALPKWVAMGPLEQHQYVPPFLLLAAGWLLFYLGLLVRGFASIGLLLVAWGWLWGANALRCCVRDSINDWKGHAHAVLVALGAGALGVLLMSAGLSSNDAGLVQAGIEIGLWLYLVPVFFIVTHRMLPFFSGSVIRGYVEYRPMSLLWLMLACCAGHGLLAVFGARSLLVGPDLLGALTMFWLVWKWQLRKSFVSHLLAMHHSAGVWLALAFALFAVQDALAIGGVAWGGRMPLHALTVGYFGSILIGMATRVTLGHSGRLISSDVWSWRLFWAFQVVVVTRLAAEFLQWPGLLNLVWLSALGWLAVFGFWCRLHLPMYIRPRPDGRAG